MGARWALDMMNRMESRIEDGRLVLVFNALETAALSPLLAPEGSPAAAEQPPAPAAALPWRGLDNAAEAAALRSWAASQVRHLLIDGH